MQFLRGPRLRFSLRTLLVLLSALCLWMGLIAKRAADQRYAVRLIESLSEPDARFRSRVLYDADHYQVTFIGSGYRIETDTRSAGDSGNWLCDTVGRDFVDSVVGVILHSAPDALPEVLEAFGRLPRLRVLSAEGEWTADEVDRLVKLKQVERLQLFVYRHSDDVDKRIDPHTEPLSQLAELSGLRELCISCTSSDTVTGDVLEDLQSLTKLETLSLVLVKRGEKRLDALANFKNLSRILLTTPMIDRGLPDILQKLPHLKELTIHHPLHEEFEPALKKELSERLPSVKIVVEPDFSLPANSGVARID